MHNLKRIIFLTLIIGALMVPTSAFAASNGSNSSEAKRSSFELFISSLLGNHGRNDDLYNYWGNNKDKNDWHWKWNFKDWNDKNLESYDIWERWYCY
ncbi:hypothetical protein [Paenibacillus radicis (ex Xue et al. 2023)]|uniref:Uncharacterized protein n=1 Tax=Paenibacillus radicis (ex Xue et al. 2023) TaxID=2972489 RepID=A0ABT1YSS7_9BACL|nr:hypothetical protein [Paenibacillus radicis (ex Xue et al. 2023)]MCR8635399.1 hypothetical protein [Paenibacillus radicis (ex Xue et al. 2023)]